MNFALQRLKQGPVDLGNNAIYGYRIMHLSDEGFKEMQNAYLTFWTEIYEIMKKDQATRPLERVVLFNLQLVPLNYSEENKK